MAGLERHGDASARDDALEGDLESRLEERLKLGGLAVEKSWVGQQAGAALRPPRRCQLPLRSKVGGHY